jgi:rhodanese-related sulfurtransferase
MKDITVQQLKQKIVDKESPILIDVREPMEYQMFNIGAELIPLGGLVQQLDRYEEQKDTEIIVLCRSGARSGTAKVLMERAGFTKVRNLTGGMLAWIEMEEGSKLQ